MPLFNKLNSVNLACVNSHSYFLFLQAMIINDRYLWLQFYLCLFAITFHMDMNRLMFIQIEENLSPNILSSVGIISFFAAKIGINFYTSKLLRLFLCLFPNLFLSLPPHSVMSAKTYCSIVCIFSVQNNKYKYNRCKYEEDRFSSNSIVT